MKRLFVLFLVGFLGLVVVDAQTPTPDWPAVGGDIGGMKYSPLDQITPANVTKLTQAWSYTGGGVPIERRDAVFEAFVTDSVPDPILGAGTGLGLKIVRDIVESYSGSVIFVDPPEGWGACVEIVLPT